MRPRAMLRRRGRVDAANHAGSSRPGKPGGHAADDEQLERRERETEAETAPCRRPGRRRQATSARAPRRPRQPCPSVEAAKTANTVAPAAPAYAIPRICPRKPGATAVRGRARRIRQSRPAPPAKHCAHLDRNARPLHIQPECCPGGDGLWHRRHERSRGDEQGEIDPEGKLQRRQGDLRASSPARSAPPPRAPMFATVATAVARARRSGARGR
jgi:hypothetical protein